MAITIPLDPRLSMPLHRRLYEHLRDQILTGRLAPGERMPSTRALSESLGVSRTTVTLSYEQLISEGYFETVTGSGTYVSRALSEGLGSGDEPETQSQIRVRLSEYGKRLLQREPFIRKEWAFPVSFRHGRPDYSRFPMTVWRRLLLRHCRANQYSMLDYASDGQGYAPLREEISRYISRSRSVRCNAGQIVIVNGSQQALDLVSRTLANQGDTVALEDPCYHGAFRAFESQGLHLRPIAVDESGLIVDRLIKSREKNIRFVYVTPSHQFPTGYVLSLPRRLQLLDWAERNRSMIVEDDYDSEYRYAAHPLPSMQGLEPGGRVLYAGTFSKVLFPALRIGYIVAPESLAPVLARAKWLTDRQTPLLEQYALTDFIRQGFLERHIRRMRKLYDQRRRTLVTELQKHFGSRVSIQGENTGMHIMVSFHIEYSAEEFLRRAAQAGVGMLSARQYYIKAKHTNQFVLGYANLTESEIREGVLRLARVRL